MPHMDDADACIDTGIVERHDLIAGQAEDGLDAQAMQRTDNQLGSKHLSLRWGCVGCAPRACFLPAMGEFSVSAIRGGLVDVF
jgi:hypothetical protein